MDVDDWLDQQEESEQKQRFIDAFNEARMAGVDVKKIITRTRNAYRNVKKRKGSRLLVDNGIVSEADAITSALRAATLRARGTSP